MGPWRLAQVPRRPPLRPWRHWSGHQLGIPGSPGWLEAAKCLRTAAWLRNRSLELTGAPWLRVGQASTRHGPAADSSSPVPWPVIYLRTWVNSWASYQHGRQASGPAPKNRSELGRSKTSAETQAWSSLRFIGKPGYYYDTLIRYNDKCRKGKQGVS